MGRINVQNHVVIGMNHVSMMDGVDFNALVLGQVERMELDWDPKFIKRVRALKAQHLRRPFPAKEDPKETTAVSQRRYVPLACPEYNFWKCSVEIDAEQSHCNDKGQVVFHICRPCLLKRVQWLSGAPSCSVPVPNP